MKSIFSMIRQDITTALRDNIVVYLIIAPLLLAFGMKMFLPSVGEVNFRFAVEDRIQQEVLQELQEYGELEYFKGEAAVRKRVGAIDSVAGIVEEDGKISLIFEGNESPEVIQTYQNILAKVTTGEADITINHISLGKENSMLLEIMTVVLVMLAGLFGGVVSGFNIVAEKETSALRAVAVSPVSSASYIAARGLLALVIGTIIAIASSWMIAGGSINYLLLMIALVASFGLTTMISLIMGKFANNQITAIAVIKVLMPIYLTVPILSIFVKEQLHYLFYVFPNYWQFQMFSNIFLAGSQRFTFEFATLATVATSIIFLLIISRSFSKQLKLR
ncbi:ABC transporter permease [Alkaliphilus hydrothermalis]|uniref:ABC-2 type transport system permease protein n=1 Tax=Alkaliphilus hydrothermalis TaxID=1482730 RepID=A0ABS2NNF1_9FIRM|nr:ABC transporter permease [Alkaliphilus hydrothermalis]MBM7614463.1 ABC-2 type transport system permease protein [Alkaliphilus hydrothermalis]